MKLDELKSKWDRELTEFASLQPGWDTHDGKPISREALRAARGFLDGLEQGWLLPCPDGGVQIEWHVNGVDVEVVFLPTGEQE